MARKWWTLITVSVLIEAASSGNLGQALNGIPAGARGTVAHAAREGFLAGMNEVLLLGALLSIVGATLPN